MASPCPFTIQAALSHSVLLKLLNPRNIPHYANYASLTSLNEAVQDGIDMRDGTQRGEEVSKGKKS